MLSQIALINKMPHMRNNKCGRAFQKIYYETVGKTYYAGKVFLRTFRYPVTYIMSM
jgi:hypothetical protein